MGAKSLAFAPTIYFISMVLHFFYCLSYFYLTLSSIYILLILPIMYFTTTSILLLLSILSASTSAQGLTQNQTCANACTAAQACDHQCAPGTSYNVEANTNDYVDCLCQTGCLCNAEICLQCCDAAGVNGADSDSCPFIQLAAGNVLAVCSVVSQPFFAPFVHATSAIPISLFLTCSVGFSVRFGC